MFKPIKGALQIISVTEYDFYNSKQYDAEYDYIIIVNSAEYELNDGNHW